MAGQQAVRRRPAQCDHCGLAADRTPWQSARTYVASEYRDRVIRVNIATGHAGPPVGTGLEPVAMTISPDGGRLYVANELGDDITVINTGTWRRAAVISVARWPGPTPDAMAISPDGVWLYVADLARNAVRIMNSSTGGVRSVSRVGRRPVALSITKDGRTQVKRTASG
jgi:YVTN family beta-propeller protein